MATYEKVALAPAKFLASDESGGRVTYDCTPEEVASLNSRLAEMLDAQLQIPLAWEHQQRAKPMTPDEWAAFLAEKCRLTCGYLKSGEVMPGSIMRVVAEVPDDEDARRVEVIKYVSPEIVWDFVDGTGRLWPGPSITHLAVTPRPVQHLQEPFKRLSLSHNRTIRLALGDSDMADKDKDKDNDENEDDLFEDDDDGDKDNDGVPDAIDDEVTPTPEVAPEPAPEAPANPLDGMMQQQKLTEILPMLAEVTGIALGPDTTWENFPDHLLTALMTKKAHELKDQQEEAPQPTGDMNMAGNPNAIEETPNPNILMSLQTKVKEQDGKIAAMQSQLIESHRKEWEREVVSLKKTGRVTPKLAAKLGGELKTARLSLGTDGKLKAHPVLTKIAAYRELDPNASWPAQQDTTTVQLGLDGSGDELVEVDNEAAADNSLDPHIMGKLTGGRWKAPAKA